MALSEWNDCTVSYAASERTDSSARRIFMNPPTLRRRQPLSFKSAAATMGHQPCTPSGKPAKLAGLTMPLCIHM
jgi:hypothetical protein